MVTTYTGWKVGDIVNICASIDEFCGTYTTNNFIYTKDINVDISPNNCGLQFGSEKGCGLHLNNVEITFKLIGPVSSSTEAKSCAPLQIYKTIGSVRTDSNGVAALYYTVTNADMALGSLQVMACITDSDGQNITSDNLSAVTDQVTISPNPCLGVICDDICIGNDLYYQTCDPTTGQCIQGILKETNSLICTATHYIEYDYSFLPQEFLDVIGSNIVDISNFLGEYAPMPSNIIYKKAEFYGNKFRIYVNYTPALIDLPEMSIYVAAGFIMFMIIEGIELWYLKNMPGLNVTPLIYAISIAIAAVGATTITYTVHELLTNKTTSGTSPGKNPGEQTKDNNDVMNTAIEKCKSTYPCVANKSCNTIETQNYNTCIQAATLINKINNDSTDGTSSSTTQTDVENLLKTYSDLQTALANGTISITDALAQIDARIVAAEKEAADKLAKTSCVGYPAGYVYDKTQQKCVQPCHFSILGYCSDTALTLGAILLGGYVIFKIASKR